MFFQVFHPPHSLYILQIQVLAALLGRGKANHDGLSSSAPPSPTTQLAVRESRTTCFPILLLRNNRGTTHCRSRTQVIGRSVGRPRPQRQFERQREYVRAAMLLSAEAQTQLVMGCWEYNRSTLYLHILHTSAPKGLLDVT